MATPITLTRRKKNKSNPNGTHARLIVNARKKAARKATRTN